MLIYDPKTRWITDARGALIAQVDETAARDPELGPKLAAGPEAIQLLDQALIMSKYHGQQGFEVERFVEDYEAWRKECRALLARLP